MVIPKYFAVERFPKFGCEGKNQSEFIRDADAESLSLSDIWPHLTSFTKRLPIVLS